MKYIRTKDGIFALSEAYWAGNKDEILAEADTIEELCDYVMMIVQGGIIPTVFKLTTMTKLRKRSIEFYYDNYKEESKRDDNWFKLAIATDKGLIYVAKMNENGDLELI